MENTTNNIESTFMDIVTNKIKKQDEKIEGMEVQIKNLPNYSLEIAELRNAVEELKSVINHISFPVKEMKILSVNLLGATTALKQPVEQTVRHHHSMDKAFLIAAILFLVLGVFVALYFSALDSISENRESDIKYRHLKLIKDGNLRSLLLQEDSIYLADPDQMHKNVIAEEEWRKEQAELLRQSKEKEEEAKRLKEKAREK